ncbi:MAG: phospholipase D-like domain-containing protein [Synechococcales bacterium]|nr:phospholipase D-like domain-containing protein [Synechococcales bacterium]
MVLLGFGLVGCQATQPIAPNLPSEAAEMAVPDQLKEIQVYFNHNTAREYTEPYRSITRSGDNLEQVILEALKSAKHQIDIAVQEFRLPEVAKMLRDRARAGVKVRVIVENTYHRPYSTYTASEVKNLPARELKRYQDNYQLLDVNQDGQLSQDEILDRDAIAILKAAGIAMIDDRAGGTRGSHLMHHKFIVIDRQQVIVTSANFTLSDFHGDLLAKQSQGNPNSLIHIKSTALANLFTQEFNILWGSPGQVKPRFGKQKPLRGLQAVQVGSTKVEVLFSPSPRKTAWQNTTNGWIAQTLGRSRASVDLALFVFSDQRLVDALEPRSLAGVKIRGLIDAGFLYRPYSSGLDMLGVVSHHNCPSELKQASARKSVHQSVQRTKKRSQPIRNHPWKQPIDTVGLPKLPIGDLLHHKFAIIDRNTVIMGSHNWTEAANYGNDETVLILQSPVVAAHYEREFDRLYNNAILGIPPTVQKRLQKPKKRC